ncbi:MAG: SDR family NAD(P)-dependent oxidoreductase [Mariprofundaceae bacterium]|nr:SDR family NAD(P)-dependent oxidoreductase [Mariprofundaceae bacterium]
MNQETTTFREFQVNDWVAFNKTFTENDFKLFSTISNDKNPLHSDETYASGTEFGQKIVPMHLTSAPLSAIAGMSFPGFPSLYLSHEISAPSPVFFDEEITYSAKIMAISTESRTLQISIVAFNQRTKDIKLKATMMVRSRLSEWPKPTKKSLLPKKQGKTVFISGASGEIGSEVALRFAKAGWNLVLNYRTKNQAIQNILKVCSNTNLKALCLEGDLSHAKDRLYVSSVLGDMEPLEAIIHCACPPVESNLSAHVDTSFLFLMECVDATLPVFLKKQSGTILFVGSTAMDFTPAGWENYAAGKSMATNYLQSLQRKYMSFGLRAFTFAPGSVLTAFSQPYRTALDATVLPEEVAENIFASVEDGISHDYIIFDNGVMTYGTHTFNAHQIRSAPPQDGLDDKFTQRQEPALAPPPSIPLLVCNFLRIPEETDLSNAGLGKTKNWDSLKHIELVLYLEKTLDITFDASQIVNLQTYKSLERTCLSKLMRIRE